MGRDMLAGVALASVIACGPQAGSGDGSADGAQTDGGTSSATADDDAEVDGGPTPGSTTAPADTGVLEDECAFADPAACPDGCARGFALQVIDDACETTSIEMCIPGGPKPGAPPTSYWTIGPSGPVFLEYGGVCGAGAQPETWTECSGAVDEPADCACFCQQGYCRGDEDRRALDGCGLPAPCPVLFVDEEVGAYDHAAEQCVLEGLRDRVPGVYEVTFASSFTVDTTRYYVFGDEIARIVLHSDDVIDCPETSDWSPADRCTLQPAEFFASCMQPTEPGDECVFVHDQWVLDCTAQPPACE